ncbi:hypothetical protein AAMO2058_000473300 [Amorphochlora amoebiformis]
MARRHLATYRAVLVLLCLWAVVFIDIGRSKVQSDFLREELPEWTRGLKDTDFDQLRGLLATGRLGVVDLDRLRKDYLRSVLPKPLVVNRIWDAYTRYKKAEGGERNPSQDALGQGGILDDPGSQKLLRDIERFDRKLQIANPGDIPNPGNRKFFIEEPLDSYGDIRTSTKTRVPEPRGYDTARKAQTPTRTSTSNHPNPTHTSERQTEHEALERLREQRKEHHLSQKEYQRFEDEFEMAGMRQPESYQKNIRESLGLDKKVKESKKWPLNDASVSDPDAEFLSKPANPSTKQPEPIPSRHETAASSIYHSPLMGTTASRRVPRGNGPGARMEGTEREERGEIVDDDIRNPKDSATIETKDGSRRHNMLGLEDDGEDIYRCTWPRCSATFHSPKDMIEHYTAHGMQDEKDPMNKPHQARIIGDNEIEEGIAGTWIKEAGNHRFREGKYEEAEKLYSQAIGQDPSQHVFYVNRANARYQLKNYTGSMLDAQEAIRRCPSFAKGHYRLGEAMMKLGHYQVAAEAYDRGASLDKKNAKLWAKKASYAFSFARRKAERLAEMDQRRAPLDASQFMADRLVFRRKEPFGQDDSDEDVGRMTTAEIQEENIIDSNRMTQIGRKFHEAIQDMDFTEIPDPNTPPERMLFSMVCQEVEEKEKARAKREGRKPFLY